jgi:hypothetical protein
MVEAGTISLKPPLKADVPAMAKEITGMDSMARCETMALQLAIMGLKARCEDRL